MTLADYISDLKISPEKFAETCEGFSASAVRKWTSGERIPRKDQMEKIFEITDGKVTPNDFYSIGSVAGVSPVVAEIAR